MPLKISLKPNEKIIIGSAVITNGSRKSEFIVNNNTTLLREKDVMTEDHANTPAKRIYFVIQLMYLGGSLDESATLHETYLSLSKDFMLACPSVAHIVADVGQYLLEENFFKALKECKKLIEHEKKVLGYAQQTSEG